MRKRGFTLVELMIVVAIIQVLAAIAVPNFHTMQLKAKRAEGPLIADGLATATLTYQNTTDTVTASMVSTIQPDTSPGKTARAWTPTGILANVGYTPDGHVRGSYKSEDGSLASCPAGALTVGADNCDFDCAYALLDVDGIDDFSCGYINPTKTLFTWLSDPDDC